MTSIRQIQANRRNSAKSTGPRTAEGRAAVRYNSLQHGLAAAAIILPGAEEQAVFEQLRQAVEEEFQPATATGQMLVDDLVAARWRINRVRTMETGFYVFREQELKEMTEKYYPTLDTQSRLARIFHLDARDSDTISKLSRYEARFEQAFQKSLNHLLRLQPDQNSEDSSNGFAPPEDVPAEDLALCPPAA